MRMLILPMVKLMLFNGIMYCIWGFFEIRIYKVNICYVLVEGKKG